MDRRELLAGAGTLLGTVSLGGCLSRYEDIAGGVGETTAEPPSGAGQPTPTDQSLEVLETGCGGRTNEASVDFAGGSVTVTGTITGADACHVARLEDAGYEADAFTVTVAAVEDEGADVCAQCLTEIDYESRFDFEDGAPGTVRVVHESMGESTAVATAEADEDL
ncbi:hypothetical protein BRC82_08000 [Halobacteriales archaeon QS_1_67_19]|nr:MAG: hypothetical protein BRC82_08000 [Halobacteriales archaeon QS_1_67_19]